MMWYRHLMHYLFGWEYVAVPYGFEHEIRRIRTTPSGIQYCIVFGEVIQKGKHREWIRVV